MTSKLTRRSLTTRCAIAAGTVMLCMATMAEGQPAGGQNRPQAPQRMMPPAGGAVQMGPRVAGPPRGAHLGQWMQQHSNLNPQQQERALQSEPGFNQLPQPMQQRMMERLNRLNSMPEQQRERVLQRGEAMERMSPQQRVEVRNTMGQLGALPVDRRRMVSRSFCSLRSLSVPERNGLLNSPQYRQQLSDEERGTLGNLLAVSPLLPACR